MNFQSRFLSAAEQVRLDSWSVEIAEEARGPVQGAGNGDWRVGDSRALIIHPGALFYDFTSSAGGRGALALIAFLHNVDAGSAGKLARAWLAAHQGEGRLAHGVADDEDAARSADDAQRIAEIETMWKPRQPPGGTLVETYLTSRGLTSCAALGWLPDLRGGEGAMIAGVTDPAGTLVAIQLTYITPDGARSTIKPQRVTWRGPHDWNRRGVVWCSAYDGSGALYVCEGVEDALSLTAVGVANVVAILGIGRLGKIVWPLGVRKLVIIRDDDPPGSPGDNTLYRGVTRQRGMGFEIQVTVRPKVVAPGANSPLKDVNDLHQHDPELVRKLLSAPPAGPEDLSAEARNAVLDEASYLSSDDYERARKATSTMLGHSRVKALDEARAARIAERVAAAMAADTEEEEAVWPDPVTNIDEVLDAAACEIKRYVKATDEAIDAVVLWIAGAHIQQRSELRINIAPRIYIHSAVFGCGKTTLLEIVMALTPRAQMVSSVSVAGLFRETDARKPTWGFDEFDKLMKGASPEHLAVLSSGHRRSSAYVIRMNKTDDGQMVTEKFSTFTAMAFTGIKKLPDDMADRCIPITLRRAGKGETPEHLIDGSSDKLIEIRRKLARWGQDLAELPKIERPPELQNRLGDNWYVMRQIAKAAGDEWCQRARKAAVGAAPPAEQGDTLALLAAIWNVFDEAKLSRMHTADLVGKLLDQDEGQWREAHHGRPITSYYLRENLEALLPPHPETTAPRRWREKTGNPQFGYDVLHFEDAFQRYLGRGLPVQVADKSKQGQAAWHSARKQGPKHPTHPTHPTQSANTSNISDSYNVSDGVSDGVSDATESEKATSTPSIVSDASGSSDTLSDTENNLQEQQVTANVSDVSDVSDTFAPPRARTAKRSDQPKGAVGRKPRKEM